MHAAFVIIHESYSNAFSTYGSKDYSFLAQKPDSDFQVYVHVYQGSGGDNGIPEDTGASSKSASGDGLNGFPPPTAQPPPIEVWILVM